MNYVHELSMKVRDYECDLQGVVNNANYQHYLEHARHEFLLAAGISFAKLHEQGTDAMVARITLNYKTPLRSGDEFVCKLRVTHEGIRYIFHQDIFRKSDNKLCLRGSVEAVCVVNGRLAACPELTAMLSNYLTTP
ncbi:MAG: acyl-CoA thioesterase [Bacteroidales bacterium]|nr:acyl-CoA thioesterase [Bacteroidales bacterium]